MHVSFKKEQVPMGLRKHGLSGSERMDLFDKSTMCCAICGKHLRRNKESGEGATAQTDHCHISGEYRGMVCRACNAILGQHKDQIPDLLAAGHTKHAEYLANHRSRSVWWKAAEHWGLAEDLLKAYKIPSKPLDTIQQKSIMSFRQ